MEGLCEVVADIFDEPGDLSDGTLLSFVSSYPMPFDVEFMRLTRFGMGTSVPKIDGGALPEMSWSRDDWKVEG